MEQRLAQGQEENPSDRVALAYDAPTNTILVASSKENFDEMDPHRRTCSTPKPNIEGVVRIVRAGERRSQQSGSKLKIEELFDEGLYNPPTKGLDSSSWLTRGWRSP